MSDYPVTIQRYSRKSFRNVKRNQRILMIESIQNCICSVKSDWNECVFIKCEADEWKLHTIRQMLFDHFSVPND